MSCLKPHRKSRFKLATKLNLIKLNRQTPPAPACLLIK
jgi:hypothetical protein